MDALGQLSTSTRQFLKSIAESLAARYDRELSVTTNYVSKRISVAIQRGNARCLVKKAESLAMNLVTDPFW
jgi:hypothetical protein